MRHRHEMTMEPVSIEPLTAGDEKLWEAYVRHNAQAGIYHQLWWRDLFRSAFRYTAHHLIAKRGDEIAGVMPLFKTPTLRGSSLSSIPFRDRAAPLADDTLALNSLLREALNLAKEFGAALLVKGTDPLDLESDLASALSHSSDWIRSVVTLPADRDAYWKKINDKTRNMIRQAEKSGLSFSLVGHEASAVNEAISVLRKTQHRLGIPPFPMTFYKDLVTILARERSGEIGTVRHQGRVVAAAILFFENNAAVYAYAGSLPEAWPLRVNDFLVWNALGTGIDLGKRFFDFGSDSSKQEELLFFKKKWGAEGQPLHFYSSGAAWRDSSQGLYPLLRGVVRRMPGPLYELTGRLTRYFG